MTIGVEAQKPLTVLRPAERDVLRRTKELLLTAGWTQEVYEAEGPVYCLIGAIGMAAHDNPCMEEYQQNYWAQLLGFKFQDQLWDWNDHQDRTIDEVIALLDEAVTEP